ncbi:YigZ family protein [Agrococcus sp. Marseille-Q4369]|uniref:IMPACT family protein n=1 Tax=Agrococcus sp. Marseille-Q4369 TaxID=2810513 RepID=UPI001B8C7B98|nr:YigZ family protein [Agrococcus sp. Marseille-Q4369]QUW19404.1 YigZ family protein [Agrococcus sp. Marseille-Q4369]
MLQPTIARSASAEVEISRSRFLATAHPIVSLDELAPLVRDTRRAHPVSRHVCSAAIVGPHGESSRSNDDGEPAGTAGSPILSAIAGRGLTDVAVLVVRWFGGVKLGTGGLVRAYGGIAADALDAAGRLEHVTATELVARLSHADAPRLEHAIRAAGHEPTIDYEATDARLAIVVEDARRAEADALLAQLGIAAEPSVARVLERPA